MKEIHPNSFVLGSLNGSGGPFADEDLIHNYNSHYTTILHGCKFDFFCKIIRTFGVSGAFSLE